MCFSLEIVWNQLKDFHTSLRQAKRQSRAAPSKKKQILQNKYGELFGQVVENVYRKMCTFATPSKQQCQLMP